MRDQLFFGKLRVLLCGWRWKSHRRASWMRAQLRRARRRMRRLAPFSSSRVPQHSAPRTFALSRVEGQHFTLEFLEPRILLAADLTGVVQSAALLDPAVPGNTASAVVRVQNSGNANVTQSQIGVYASLDNVLDASDLLLGTVNTGSVAVGASKNVTVNLTFPNTLQPIDYTLLAKVDNANAITENSETNNVAVGGTVNGTWQFGAVPGRTGNTTLTLREADGTVVTFSLTGPGLGEVIKDGATWDLNITGTTANSAVTILTNSAGNGRVTLNDIHVGGPLAAFSAATTDLTGTLAIDGPVKISGAWPGAITLRSVQGGTVAVPSVEALTIFGPTTNANFHIGTTFGQDGQPGGTGVNADTHGQGKIGLFTVTGAMTKTSVRVGVDPVDGLYGNGNDQLIGGTNSSIGGIVIAGSLSADTRFYAGKFPTQYLHGLTLKPTAGDVHFVLLASGNPTTLNAALQQDTGSSTSDRLTSNPTIVGTLTDADGIATFVAGFGATPSVDIRSNRQADGSFTLTRARLEEINGGAMLSEGSHTLTLRATDNTGNATQITAPFTLDTQIPTLTLDLDPASDTAPVGDQQTTHPTVTLDGQTEALAVVELVGLGLTTTANASGNFSFSNVALTLGANAFTVRATDTAGNQRTESRTITRVAPANQPPVAHAQTVATEEDTAKPITLTGSDSDGDSLTYTIVDGPTHGTLTGTGATRTYTPDDNYHGPDTFTFTVNDGTVDSNVATVTIDVTAVNDAPVLVPIGNQTVNEETELTFTATANDPDSAQTKTFSLENGSGGLVPNGASITSGGVFIWTPSEAQGSGTYTFDVVVTDNGTPALSDRETITVTVNEVNRTPTFTSSPIVSVQENRTQITTVTASDVDVPAQALTFSLAGGADSEAFTITSGGALSFVTAPDFEAPTDANFDNVYEVTVQVSDGHGGVATQAVRVTVQNVNDTTPQISVADVTQDEGTSVDGFTNLNFTVSLSVPTTNTVTVQVRTFDIEATAASGDYTAIPLGPPPTILTFGPGETTKTVSVQVRQDDLVEGNERLQVQLSNATNATIIDGTGTGTITNDDVRSFSINDVTVTEGDTGTVNAAFTVTLSQSSPGTVTLSAATAPDSATSGSDYTTTSQLLTFASGVTQQTFTVPVAGDTLLESTEQFFVNLSNPTSGLVIADGQGIGTIVDNDVNLPPVLNAIGNRTVNEETELTFMATANDPNTGQTKTFSLEDGSSGLVPEGASITPGGLFTWTPTEAQGPDSYTFDVVVSDGTLTDSETITVTVNEVNRAPTLATIPNQTATVGQQLTFTAVGADTDQPNNTLTYSLEGLFSAGAAIDPVSGVFAWTPTAVQVGGPHGFTVRVTDNGSPNLFAEQTVQITVEPRANQAPILSLIDNQTVNEGQQLTFAANATDPDGVTTFLFSLEDGVNGEVPAGASIDAGTGGFFWTPSEAQGPETYTFDVVVTDNGTPTLSDRQTVTVTVNEVNQAPTLAVIPNQTVTAGQLLTFTAVGTDPDIPANGLTYSLQGTTPAGAEIDSVTGVFTWTPTAAQEGPQNITVRVTDNGTDGLFAERQVQVTVAAGNQAPVLASISNKTVIQGQSLTFTATATDSDVPAQQLTFSLQGTSLPGANITPGGDFTWTPTAGQVGTHSVTVRVTDNGSPALFDEETFTINVNPAQVASFQGLGELPGGLGGSFANSVATQQPVVVGSSESTSGREAFRWTSAGGIQGLGDIPGGSFFSQAHSVSSDGSLIVGDSSGSSSIITGWLWTDAAGMIALPNLSGNVGESRAFEVSADGTVIVGYGSDGSGSQAVRWISDGLGGYVAQSLGDLPGGSTSRAFSVSHDGSVIVGEASGTTFGTTRVAFRWTQTSGLTMLGGVPVGFVAEVAHAVSADGTVVVGDGTSVLGREAFRWTATGGLQRLGDLPGGALTSQAFGVSGGGQVIVGVATSAAGEEAFIWDQANGMRSLKALLVNDLGLGAGWTLTRALDISDDGRVIVGYGINPSGQGESWRAVLPAVLPVNQSPILNPIGNQTVNEGSTLTFTASATDSNPFQSMMYSLQGTVPAGASINTDSGVFSWTPTEAQGPGTYSFDVVARDNSSVPLEDRETITVTVNEIDENPVLNAIGDRSVNEGELLSFTATATPWNVSQVLTFSLVGTVPIGAAINATTGGFTWTPTEQQGPDSYQVTVRVSDAGVPTRFDEETITIQVAEVNQAPVLAPITDQTVTEGQTVSFTASGTDADVLADQQANELTYSLEGTVPTGAGIDSQTGLFTWVTSVGEAGTHSITVRVTDNGTPSLFSERTVNVTVNAIVTTRWINPDGGFWNDAANWDGGVVPTLLSDVVIDIPVSGEIVIGSDDELVARTITVTSPSVTGLRLETNARLRVESLNLGGTTLTLDEGSTLNVTGPQGFINEGVLVITAPEAIPATLNLAGGATFINRGTLQENGGLVVNGVVENDGTGRIEMGSVGSLTTTALQNRGTFLSLGGGMVNVTNVFVNEGFLQLFGQFDVPGASILTVTGDFTNGSAGTVVEEVNLFSGAEYGQLVVTGTAILDGTLHWELNYPSGSPPAVGSEYLLMSFGSHVFAFTQITGIDRGGSGITLVLDEFSDQLRLRVVGP